MLQIVVLYIKIYLRLYALNPIEQVALKTLHSSDLWTRTVYRLRFCVLNVDDLILVAQNLERVRNALVVSHTIAVLNIKI